MELQYEYAGKLYPVNIVRDGPGFRVNVGEEEYKIEYNELKEGFMTLNINGKTVKCNIATEGSQRHIFIGGNVYRFNRVGAGGPAGGFDALPANITSPISGKVIAVSAEEGAAVDEGRVILTIEAMKMEYQIKAPYAGKVEKIHFKVGDQVDIGALLVDMEKEEQEK
jgi:3-methylcrotonyl-CoA carboxylase alpha subunit